MRGKKAGIWYFNAFFIFVMLVVFGVAFATVYSKTDISKKFGNLPKAILGAYHKGEKILFYVDYAAKNSIYQAAYDSGQKGGFYNPGCGDYLDYALWDEGCLPSIGSLKHNLGLYLQDNLNNYLLGYPEEDVFIPQDNYDFLIKNDKVIGIATENIEFDVKWVKEKRKIPEIATRPNVDVFDQYYNKLNSRSRLEGVAVDRIILHHTGGSDFISAYNAMLKKGYSAHYAIDRDGTIYYLVDENRVAYHAKGWNARSIGIEIVNTGYRDMMYTDEQYMSIERLGKDIASRWPEIEWNNEHAIGHYQASEIGKWDPSQNFDWARIGLPGHVTLAGLGKTPPEEFGYA